MKRTPQQQKIKDIADRLPIITAGAIASKLYGEDNKINRNLVANQISKMRRIGNWPFKLHHSAPLNTPKSTLDVNVNGETTNSSINILAEIDKLMDNLDPLNRKHVIDYLNERFK